MLQPSSSWTTGSGRLVNVIPVQSRLADPVVNSLLFSSDGKKLFALIAGLFEKKNRAEIRILHTETGLPAQPGDFFIDDDPRAGPGPHTNYLQIPCPALSPDDVWIVHKDVVIDTRNGKQTPLVRPGQRLHPLCSSFSPGGALLASGVWKWEQDRAGVQIRDTSSWSVVREWDCPDNAAVNEIAFSPDGKWVAGTRAYGDISGHISTIWDATNGSVRSTFQKAGSSFVWSPDGNFFTKPNGFWLRSAGTGHRIFGLGFKGSLLGSVLALGADTRLETFIGEETVAEDISRKLYTPGRPIGIAHGRPFSPDGTRMVACDGRKLYMADAKTGEILTSFNAYPPSLLHMWTSYPHVCATAFCPDGIHLAAAIYTGRQPEIRMWRP